MYLTTFGKKAFWGMQTRRIFITGGTGYVGRQMIPLLLKRGHGVRALVRPGSERRIPPGSEIVLGNPLGMESFSGRIAPCDTFVQLVGVPHPSPAKAKLFRSVDLVSAKASIAAAVEARVEHFIYLSVAQPAPVMKAYQAVRAEAEAALAATQLPATVLRPWYILGPGHRWPVLLLPVYWLCELIPRLREDAHRVGLVTLNQIVRALVHVVENPAPGLRTIEVPQIRELSTRL